MFLIKKLIYFSLGFLRMVKLQEKPPAFKKHPAFKTIHFLTSDPDPADQNQCGTGSTTLIIF
jgi:hypothetical protein